MHASAEIAGLAPTARGVSVAAIGSHDGGIGRVDFVIVDLTRDALANVLDRKDVDYAKAPTQVNEAWSPEVRLAPEPTYRVFFHVYDATGVNLVAYDRRDFTCRPQGAEHAT